jgi:hypothetical protein
MSIDRQFHELLRSAVPPAQVRPRGSDRWPELVRRSQAPVRLSRLDFGLLAVLTTALVLFPRVAWLLAYHL